jgi:phenol hydroxylase P1 protein
LQRACLISALGWALGGAGALRSARRIWLEDPGWQALRRYAEDALAMHDPLECAFALSLMLDGLLQPLLGACALRRCVGDEASALASYFDALIESSATELVRAGTAALAQWAPRAASAALPVVERVWGPDTDEKLGAAMEKLAAWPLPDGGAVGMRCA